MSKAVILSTSIHIKILNNSSKKSILYRENSEFVANCQFSGARCTSQIAGKLIIISSFQITWDAKIDRMAFWIIKLLLLLLIVLWVIVVCCGMRRRNSRLAVGVISYMWRKQKYVWSTMWGIFWDLLIAVRTSVLWYESQLIE